MPNPHNNPISVSVVHPSRNLQAIRQAFWQNDQRVVSGCNERILDAGKHTSIVVLNSIRLSMHQFWGSHDFAAKSLPNRLMPKANAQNGKFAVQLLDQRNANSRFGWRAGTRRQNDSLGLHGPNFINRYFIVPDCLNVQCRIDLSQSLHQVVSKRIVVINQEYHLVS